MTGPITDLLSEHSLRYPGLTQRNQHQPCCPFGTRTKVLEKCPKNINKFRDFPLLTKQISC